MGIKLENPNLTDEQRQKLTDLIEHNFDMFAYKLSDLPGTSLQPHVIDTGDSLPHRTRPYRYAPKARQEIEKQTQELLDSGMIQPSQYVCGLHP